MSKKEKSTLFTFGSIGAASVGGILFLLAFGLPYWVDYKDDVTVNGASVNLRYTYGFWRYCNKQEFVNGNADVCDNVNEHTGVEQATISLILVTMLLYVSTLVNSTFYVSLFKQEILCLYISLISIVAAGVVSLVGVINFGSADHSITVNNNIMLSFKPSNLSASFWLAAVGCVDAVVTTIVVILAIRANRDENPKEDEKSIVSSSPSRVSTGKLNFYSNGSSPERQRLNAGNSNGSFVEDTSERFPSSSASDSSSDSDDSQLDSKFTKLKFKNLRTEENRPKSSKTETIKQILTKKRSQSVPYFPPVEQVPQVDFTDDVARVKTEQILHSVFHAGDLEPNHPPPSTLISDLSPIRKVEPTKLRVAENTDAFQRARSEIIVSKRKEELPEQSYVNIEDTVIEVEHKKKKRSGPKFLQKRKVSKSKRVEMKHDDNKMVADVYSKTNDMPIYETRGNAMPAPWTLSEAKKKKQGPHKTSTSMKWALVARGVYQSK